VRLPRSGGKVNSTKTPSNLILKAPEEKETKKARKPNKNLKARFKRFINVIIAVNKG